MTIREMLLKTTADNDQDQAECDAWMRRRGPGRRQPAGHRVGTEGGGA